MAPLETGKKKTRKVILSVVVGADVNEDRVVSAEVFSSSQEARRYLRFVRSSHPRVKYMVLRSELMVSEGEPLEVGRRLWVVMLCDGPTPRQLSIFFHELHAAHHEIPLRQKHVAKFTGKIIVSAWPCELDGAVLPPGPEEG